MKRGDIVTLAMQGGNGKPRPAIIVQADAFEGTATVVVLPLSSTRLDAAYLRVSIEPTAQNGLRCPSQAMVNRVSAVRREKIGAVCGTAEAHVMRAIDRALLVVLGIA